MTNAAPKLPKVFKRKWVEALRSGKFTQTTYELFDPDKQAYCCLGVACVVHDPEAKPDGERLLLGMVPKKALDALLAIRDGLDGVDTEAHLMHMNDILNAPFPKIADWIEEHL